MQSINSLELILCILFRAKSFAYWSLALWEDIWFHFVDQHLWSAGFLFLLIHHNTEGNVRPLSFGIKENA